MYKLIDNAKNEKRQKRRYQMKIFCCMLILIYGIMLIAGQIEARHQNENYVTLELSQVACKVPIEYWQPDEDYSYASDHMFLIREKNNEYIIYGSELNKCNEDDWNYGLIQDQDKVAELIDAPSESQVRNGIRDCTGLLNNNVIEHRSIIKQSYAVYSFSSIEQIGDEEYHIYTIYYVQEDVRFLEIVLEKSPGILTEEDKEKMLLYTYLN